MNKLRYGAAYYEEYLPYDRLDEDVRMMKKAGINTVRIAESTWSTCEPQEGIFAFFHVERALEQAEVPVPREHFPVIVKKGINGAGREITFYLNYSPEKRIVKLQSGEEITIPCWGSAIREKDIRI